ncbi:hypothetical protein, partial [Raoultella sp. BIGb0399]|uniref:hypothetical protein n=1 Tax=Raoultella sp. BIGb0399 TaxID=2485119 RepID=UPI001D0DA6EF
DKLLKSSATALSALSRGGVYYAFLFQSQPHFQKFSLSTRRLVCRCSVSMEAHYREPAGNDKRKNAFLFQPLIFYT